ncbi:MAG TPA: glycosyltransferase family 4 protein [Pyrinomonadaceae bacterium]|nr:glycosyltransferase family 4 protein [Pyrinomonadaceae bacterium]
MKILFYNHTGKVSGAERVLLMILSKLDRSRFDPVVLCPADGRLIESVRALGVKTVEVDPLAARFTWRVDRLVRYVVSFISVVRAARVAVVREAPDIVQANSIRAGLVMSAATVGLSVPVVWHVHDLLPRHPLSTLIRLFVCASRRNQVIAISRAVAARFSGKLFRLFRRRVPVMTILNAVDLERFQPDSESRKELRRALGVAEGQVLIGSVGQLTPRKGQRELIDAFAEVAREIPNAVLLIIGEALFNRDAEYAESLVRAANSSGFADRIRFLGPREDVPALMRALDLLVVNSRAEPFGLTVVEAMASGTTVLASATDGIPEIVRHGESGWLVNGGDHASLVAAISMLLCDANLRRRLSDNALRDVRARFSAVRFSAEMNAFYRNTITRGKTPHNDLAGRLTTELSAD